jgi:integrase
VSIQKRGSSYVVRWREGGHQLQRSFLKHRDAVAFETDTKRRQQLGALAPGVIQSRMTLVDFVREEWWPRYAVPNLKPSTQRRYLEVWGTHLLPALGDYELRAITPMLVEDLRAQFDAQEVGIQTQRKALMLLQGILRRAVVRGLIPAAELSQRDATMISVLAYAGLRPDEATSAHWRDVGDRSLHVHASKTERARTIKLLAPLVEDLPARLVRLPAPVGGPQPDSDTDHRAPAAKTPAPTGMDDAGLEPATSALSRRRSPS